MNYIWTYWPNPEKDMLFDLACLALSSAFVSRYATAKCVFTDSFGARQIEKYQIPIPVACTLDGLYLENRGKFALAKVDTYSRVEFPCTHIDYDVFLARFQKTSDADFCCQSLEDAGIFTGTYKAVRDCFIDEGGVLPKEIRPYSDTEDLKGYNMGYLQINNIEFLHKYAAVSRPVFSMMKTVDYGNNILPEQYLFYCMTATENIKVDVLFPESMWSEPERDKHHAVNGYTHFMGKKQRIKRLLFCEVLKKLQEFNENVYYAIYQDIDWSQYPITKQSPITPCRVCMEMLKDVPLPHTQLPPNFHPFWRYISRPHSQQKNYELTLGW